MPPYRCNAGLKKCLAWSLDDVKQTFNGKQVCTYKVDSVHILTLVQQTDDLLQIAIPYCPQEVGIRIWYHRHSDSELGLLLIAGSETLHDWNIGGHKYSYWKTGYFIQINPLMQLLQTTCIYCMYTHTHTQT